MIDVKLYTQPFKSNSLSMAETSYFELESERQPEREPEQELEPGPKRESRKQLDTPGKNRVLGYIQCCEDHHIRWTKAAVARACKVSRMQVDYAVKNPSPRTKKNSGPPNRNAQKISSEELDAVERHVKSTKLKDGQAWNWHEVVAEFKLNITGRHLHELMKPRLSRSRIKTVTPRDPKKAPSEQQPEQWPQQPPHEEPSREQTSQVQLPVPEGQLPLPQLQPWP